MSCGFFPSSRGLHQGDPLSPSLFIVGAEVLSRLLNQLLLHPRFNGFKVPRGCPLVSHLGYADDILIFSSASAVSLKLLMEMLKKYELVSGQRINASKSCFMIHPRLSRTRKVFIQSITGFFPKEFPSNYLGCPLMVGRRKKAYFQNLITTVAATIASWKNHLLSLGGMVVRSEGASHTWCRTLHVRDITEQHITFIIHSGDSNFRFDN